MSDATMTLKSEPITISLADLGITKEEWEAEMALYCDCDEPDESPKYKPDGISLMGCTKHGWVCRKCNKFVQIG